MFEVRTKSAMDDEWEARDDAIREVAGRSSDFSGAGFCTEEGCGGRDHGWEVATFAEAVALRDRLSAVPGVRATVREKTTYGHLGGGHDEPPPPAPEESQ